MGFFGTGRRAVVVKYSKYSLFVIGMLVIHTIALQAPKSRVPSFPCQIVFVIGIISTPRYRHAEKGGFWPTTKNDVINHADVTDVITRTGDTWR